MKNIIKANRYLLFLFLVLGCTSSINRFAEESYKIKPSIRIEEKLALLSMMAAGSSSLNLKSMPRVVDAPYSPSRIVRASQISLPGKTSMEGFRNSANDILVAKFKQKKSNLTIIPPKQAQAVISQSDLTVSYLEFLRNYTYLSANKDFLIKLGKHLNCRYLMIPQLVVISNVNDSSFYLVWAFGKRSANYSVIILGQVWDLSTGELIWTGRGTSSTIVGVYEKPASFDQLAAEASEELIRILP